MATDWEKMTWNGILYTTSTNECMEERRGVSVPDMPIVPVVPVVQALNKSNSWADCRSVILIY